MNQSLALRIAGLVFVLIALLHALRLYYQWPVLVGTYLAPMQLSMIGLGFAILLALWMFVAASRK